MKHVCSWCYQCHALLRPDELGVGRCRNCSSTGVSLKDVKIEEWPAVPPGVVYMQKKPPTAQPLADAGHRTQFATGSQRDTQDGKPRPGLCSARANLRTGVIHMLGSIKYEARNWEKGQPQSQFFESMIRHLIKWQMGDTAEDHLAQARWNMDCLLDQEERYVTNSDERITEQLFDLPWYGGDALEVLRQLPTRVFLDGTAEEARAASQRFREHVASQRKEKAE